MLFLENYYPVHIAQGFRKRQAHRRTSISTEHNTQFPGSRKDKHTADRGTGLITPTTYCMRDKSGHGSIQRQTLVAFYLRHGMCM